MEENVIHAKIFRYSPEDKASRVDRFKVPHSPGMTFQTMLRYIYENIDPTLAFRDFRCGKGICNTCSIKVNGKVIRSCEKPVQPGEEVLLEPANDRIIKDLVVQLD
jgi:succinate dehydrogenase/fumarate reductase-like Fe-S protein